eukprot:7355278-Alexandrium_andersonii.AAC.1
MRAQYVSLAGAWAEPFQSRVASACSRTTACVLQAFALLRGSEATWPQVPLTCKCLRLWVVRCVRSAQTGLGEIRVAVRVCACYETSPVRRGGCCVVGLGAWQG